MFNLDICPTAASRPRFSKWGGIFYTPKYTQFKKDVLEIIENLNLNKIEKDKPIVAIFNFYIPIAKSTSKKQTLLKLMGFHTAKPDLDNLIKGVLDGLNEIAYHDDSQIVSILINKEWTEKEAGKIEFNLKEIKNKEEFENIKKIYADIINEM